MTSDDRPAGISPLTTHLASVAAARYADYAGRNDARVRDTTAFEAMRAHITALYEGVTAVRSFTDANGQVFDCIPIEQQPGLRGRAGGVPEPPDLPAPEHGTSTPGGQPAASPYGPGEWDAFGNPTECPPGTIPLRRITLEEMTRFESLSSFFQKSPGGGDIVPKTGLPQPPQDVHKYASANQDVNNLGAHCVLNVWQPPVTGAGQFFSLSQQWTSAGSGASTQTAEVGWQVYPGKYNGPNPVLFTYWTATNYVGSGAGCYNLECGAFVHTNAAYTPGRALTDVSTAGGHQAELEVAWYLFQGNWWLYAGGTKAANAIGYYPVSIYQGGALSTGATSITFGGEVDVTQGSVYPPMGSGKLANAGYAQAAYQRDLYYYTTAARVSQFASLQPFVVDTPCYSLGINH